MGRRIIGPIRVVVYMWVENPREVDVSCEKINCLGGRERDGGKKEDGKEADEERKRKRKRWGLEEVHPCRVYNSRNPNGAFQ